LEEATVLADELNDGETGWLVERALDPASDSLKFDIF
jgi:hypothetical protein